MGQAPVSGSGSLDRVLEAAKELFVEQGYNNTSLAQIARAAGTSDTGVLRVAHSKSVLLKMVCGLCWLDTNKALDALVEAARRVDSDPRFVTTVVMVGLLDRYETTKQQSHFMISHFPTLEVSDEVKNIAPDSYIGWLLNQYTEYLGRLGALSRTILDDSDRLSQCGISAGILTEWLAVVRYGVLMSWFQVDRGSALGASRVTLNEVENLVILTLYGEMDEDSRRAIKTAVRAIRGV